MKIKVFSIKTVIFLKFVRYKHEIFMKVEAKPNQKIKPWICNNRDQYNRIWLFSQNALACIKTHGKIV